MYKFIREDKNTQNKHKHFLLEKILQCWKDKQHTKQIGKIYHMQKVINTMLKNVGRETSDARVGKQEVFTEIMTFD